MLYKFNLFYKINKKFQLKILSLKIHQTKSNYCVIKNLPVENF
jgi:hypothetical protein